MGAKKQLSTNQRIEKLTCLISDAEELNFNPKLINEYKKQLSKLKTEVKQEKDFRK